MIFFETARSKARKLKQNITALYYAYRNPDLGWKPKLMIGLTLAYALSPVDLIPDFIPVLGYLDDLILVPLMITLSLKLIPSEIMKKAKEQAEKEPLSLKKNWFTGIIFILIWGILFGVIIYRLIHD